MGLNQTQTVQNQLQETVNSQYKGKYHHTHAHNQPGKHLFYQNQLHQLDNKSVRDSFQDHCHVVTVNAITNNTFQDCTVP